MDSCWNETIKVCPEGDGEAPLWKVPVPDSDGAFRKNGFPVEQTAYRFFFYADRLE